MTYTLSYYRPQNSPVLVRRPWWAFWRHDRLEPRQVLTRFVFANIPEDEAKILMLGGHPAGMRLVRRLMGSDATMLQLEADRPAPMYTPTTGYVETQANNMMPNSGIATP